MMQLSCVDNTNTGFLFVLHILFFSDWHIHHGADGRVLVPLHLLLPSTPR
jgi:hypothetical protein